MVIRREDLLEREKRMELEFNGLGVVLDRIDLDRIITDFETEWLVLIKYVLHLVIL
jgi:hypothetical protein